MSKAQRNARKALSKRAALSDGSVPATARDRKAVRDTWNNRTMSPAWAWKRENSHAMG